MGSINKGFSLLLVVILATSSLMMAKSAFAQSIPKPSMPQFTIRYIDESFDASTQPSIDPYTGEAIPPNSYHVDRRYIQVSIRNDLPTISAGSPSEYYYNVRYKGQFTEDWTEAKTAAYGYYRPSDSAYTLINYTLSSFSIIGKDLAVGTKIDFQVILMYGVIGKDISQGPLGPEYFSGETSGWSSTKTVTVGDTSFVPAETSPNPTATSTQNPTPTPTQNPTPTPSIPEFSSWTIPLLLGLMVATAGLLVYHKRKR